MKSPVTLAALAALLIGLAGAPANAQQAVDSTARLGLGQHRALPMRHPAMGPGGMLMLACSDKGAEALEVALVRIDHRLDLTADQQKLFDAFRTSALSAETSFADTCKAALPDRAADKAPDLLARMKASLAVEQARLTAMNSVLPDFEAFYNSLTDAQKAALQPRFGKGLMLRDRDSSSDDASRSDAGRTPRPPAPGR